MTEVRKRPDGYAAVVAGCAMLAIGLVASFVWLTTNPVDILGIVDGAKVTQQYWAGMVAAFFVPIGTTTLLVGYIVRAIWFLPGDATRAS